MTVHVDRSPLGSDSTLKGGKGEQMARASNLSSFEVDQAVWNQPMCRYFVMFAVAQCRAHTSCLVPRHRQCLASKKVAVQEQGGYRKRGKQSVEAPRCPV